jgi:hypothetical protein
MAVLLHVVGYVRQQSSIQHRPPNIRFDMSIAVGTFLPSQFENWYSAFPLILSESTGASPLTRSTNA